MEYAIVGFTDECDAPGMVSDRWLDADNNTCWYPNVRCEELKKHLMIMHESPEKDWLKCHVKVLKKFSNYPSAVNYFREAVETFSFDDFRSDLEFSVDEADIEPVTEEESQSEFMGPRKRKKKTHNFPDSSSEEESQSLSELRPGPSDHLQSLKYTSVPFFSSLTFSTPHSPHPPVVSKESTSAVSNNQALNNKMDSLLQNQQNLWGLVEELLEATKRLEDKLDNLMTNQGAQVLRDSLHNEDREDLQLISSLPLKLEDFMILENKIAAFSNFKTRLINVLMTVGAKDIKGLVCNVLRKLIIDEVGELFSLTGKSTKVGAYKQSFERTESYKLILEICHRNFKEFKTNQMREAISDWLMQSKFRRSKRKRRSEMRAAGIPEEI